jgi:hypothetical protein
VLRQVALGPSALIGDGRWDGSKPSLVDACNGLPNLRLRVSGLSCRAFVAEGWTHEMKAAVLEMGFRTIFEGRVPKRAGVTEGVLEKERAATAGEHEAAKKACDEARGQGQDVQIFGAARVRRARSRR